MNNPKVFSIRKEEAHHLREIRDNFRGERARGRQEGFTVGVLFCVAVVAFAAYLMGA